jgi:hypothetical protein
MSASRVRWLLIGLVLVVLPASSATETGRAVPKAVLANPWGETPTTHELRERAVHFRRIARHWRRLMGKEPPVLRPRERPFESLYEQRLRSARRWHAKALRARRLAHEPPHETAWRCIHRHEGPWDDPNAPYYGGLQMDLTFQRTYARWLLRREGTANRWAPLEQMWVAERAVRSGRGFYPWPVSARRCGLI